MDPLSPVNTKGCSYPTGTERAKEVGRLHCSSQAIRPTRRILGHSNAFYVEATANGWL